MSTNYVTNCARWWAILELSVYLQQQAISNKAIIHYKSSPKFG
jgi:hypothetical protein